MPIRSNPELKFLNIGLLVLASCISMVVLATCGGDSPTESSPPQPPPPPVQLVPTRITITPAVATLMAIGQTLKLTASVLDQNGQPITGANVLWSSGNTSVVSVSSQGLVTAVSNGTVQITARAGSASASAAVTVAQTANGIMITPQNATLMSIGETVQLAATVLDQNRQPVSGAVVSWQSSQEEVATVSPQGLVTAVMNGTAQITATAGSASTSAEIRVMQSTNSIVITPEMATLMSIGETVQLVATVLDQNGQPVAGAVVSWQSGQEEVATVSSQGLVTAVMNGTATITARSGNAMQNATVKVMDERREGSRAKRFVLTCPSPEDIAAIDQDLEIQFIDDLTANRPLICREDEGSVDLTEVQFAAYQSLILMRAAKFSEPLPWTQESLWDWFTGTIDGIDFDSNAQNSFCCRRDNGTRIVVTTRIEISPDDEVSFSPLWILVLRGLRSYTGAEPIGWIQLFVHEARHAEGPIHTCEGTKDQTFAEMGAFAYAWYTWFWFEHYFIETDFFDFDDRKEMQWWRDFMCDLNFCEKDCPE